jgi:type IV secretion system protein VirD4
MTPTRLLLALAPALIMPLVAALFDGSETWLAGLSRRDDVRAMALHAAGMTSALASGGLGVVYLLACGGALAIRWAGGGVALGVIASIAHAWTRGQSEIAILDSRASPILVGPSDLTSAKIAATAVLAIVGLFAMRVLVTGNRIFEPSGPKRIRGRRALHGDADWMSLQQAARLFPAEGGIVIGEQARVDRQGLSAVPFRPDRRDTWGNGGKAQLLCFDGSFGSSHGVAFAGSGGFKTTSVTIPTALKWGGSLVLLDPSVEVAPMVAKHRENAGRDVFLLDPRVPDCGVNVLDWIGRFGSSMEEDISAVASWIMSDSARPVGLRDDFFRASSLQLLTALIADVCLSGNTLDHEQTLRQVRKNLAEPEPKLRSRLEAIYDGSKSEFVRENVAAFVNMTPETFSGVYANAVKETHWLSYANYAALVSGSSFSTADLANGQTDVFINIDLKTLETHAGLARVLIGAFLNAIYNRAGDVQGRTLFLLDEAARLGPMRIIETARDAGRKYGVTLLMLYQSIGQMREAYGGADATSKWFESASWVSFAAINDPDTADYISRRCGLTTVEADQISRSVQAKGSSQTRSKQLASRPLIQPHEVLRMRSDEQIVFTAGNPPLRCGRAIWFRRDDMSQCVARPRFGPGRQAPGHGPGIPSSAASSINAVNRSGSSDS